MSIFSEHILKSLNDYKRLLRRYLSNSERESAIINLGIKRKSLKSDSDVILYNKALRVLEDIEYWSAKLNRVATEYSGIDEFYNYLKNYLSQYQVENNTVVNVNHRASCALVQAIQLIGLPEKALNSQAAKLENCIETIAKFCTKDQRRMLARALCDQKNEGKNIITTSSTLENFVRNNLEPANSDEPFYRSI